MAATGPSQNSAPLLLLALLLLGFLSGDPGRSAAVVASEAGEESEAEGGGAAPVAAINVGLPSPPEDHDEKCPEWAAEGECLRNRPYMLEHCAVSCKVRSGERTQVEEGGSDPGRSTMARGCRGEASRWEEGSRG